MARRIFFHVLSVLLGATLASVGWWQYLDYQRLLRRSMVDRPVATMLEHLVTAPVATDCEITASKLQAFNQHWSDFLVGGPDPEQFVPELIDLEVVD